jgi:hypothetical protein
VVLAVLIALGALFGGGYWSVHQPPAFYAEEIRKPVDPVQRKQAAKEFVQATLQLVDEIQHDRSWSEQFTQDQINAWLAEELPRKYPGWIPPNTSDPRVKLEKDAIELAFKSDDPRFKGVISGRFEPFVAGPNQIGVRIRRIRLGLVPLPIDQVIEQIEEPLAEAVAEADMTMRWQQIEGEDVLVLELKTENNRPVLETIQITAGQLAISGSRRELARANSRAKEERPVR